jgi:hypothetical protein
VKLGVCLFQEVLFLEELNDFLNIVINIFDALGMNQLSDFHLECSTGIGAVFYPTFGDFQFFKVCKRLFDRLGILFSFH